MALNKVYMNKARVDIKMTRIGVGQARKVLRYVHRQAVIGATGGPYSRGQSLARSITTLGPIITGKIVRGTVFSPLSYAASVERGAKIHPIFPKGMAHVYRFGSKRPPQLRFIWRGRVVYTPQVPMGIRTIVRSHPGQKGKRFLRNALMQAAVRFQMRFIPGSQSF
jgi:hypothetical protein